MRFTDMVMAFPIIILAMTIAAALGPGLEHTMIALVAVSWPRYARVTRGLVLSVKENEYVHASRALGATPIAPADARRAAQLPGAGGGHGHARSRQRHPDLLRAQLSGTGLAAAGARVGRDGRRRHADVRPVVGLAFPGLAILTLVMAFNFIGDGVRDALDPRLRRSL